MNWSFDKMSDDQWKAFHTSLAAALVIWGWVAAILVTGGGAFWPSLLVTIYVLSYARPKDNKHGTS
jgi:hypothetical protein